MSPRTHEKLLKKWAQEREKKRRILVKPIIKNREVLEVANYYDRSYNLINFFQIADDETLISTAKKLPQGARNLKKLQITGKDCTIKRMVQGEDGKTTFVAELGATGDPHEEQMRTSMMK